MSRFAATALLALAVTLPARAPAAPAPAPAPPAPVAAAPAPSVARLLPIADRAHAPEAPPQGWCGETAIQEGLLHLGVWAPQRLIYRAGRPTHPDLYAPDLPVALTELGVRYTVYRGERGFDPFARWVRTALDAGDPVLAGVKILPTQHPEWGLDHFVLVVGYGSGGLLVNTTWSTRAWVGDTTTPGLSLKNAFYGLRLTGLDLPESAHPARLTLLEEGASVVKLRVACSGLDKGARYRLERASSRSEAAAWSMDVAAPDGSFVTDVAVPADRSARFQCVPLAPPAPAPAPVRGPEAR